MSTKNNASQTLFRMVSLRNPQLTETKRRNLSFIQRPKGAVGVFDEAINNRDTSITKIRAIENFIKASEFSNTAIQNEKEIEDGVYAPLLIIGRKISKKENISEHDWLFTKNYYASLIDSNKELKSHGITIFKTLWDNLIYQTISQKDFYVKEALSDILKAIHLGFAQSINPDDEFLRINGTNPVENALNGKITLPKELFIEEQTKQKEVQKKLTKSTEFRLSSEAQMNLNLQTALIQKEELENLETELKTYQKSYYKQKDLAYKNQYAEYLKNNELLFTEYERISKEIESLKALNTPENELNTYYEQLNQIQIPSFEINATNEVDLSEIKLKLSADTFETFASTFTTVQSHQDTSVLRSVDNQDSLSNREMIMGENVIQLTDGIETLEDVISNIEAEKSYLNKIIFDNTPLYQEQYLNLEGATIPINSIERTPLAYAVTGGRIRRLLGTSQNFISFSVEVENSAWNVLSAKISGRTENGPFEEVHNNIMVKDNKINFPALLKGKFKTYPTFKIEIVFANGREASAVIPNAELNTVKTGLLTLKPIIEETPIENTAEKNDKSRKNFGIKRLGIADYLKVVQSVHAYVPGLVSNIENVMASELRHKSSVSRDYSEITDTTSKYQETEKASDTSKTSRADMQTEIAKELDKQQSITANSRFSYNSGAYNFELAAGYANNTAQHDSTRQAIMKSQEITEKAMERVLTKISEERVQKIIKEYTETNVHEFDNRGKVTETDNPEAAQPKHITGVYRWIDIKYKNQIYNYGKRTMFEFMVPEPAKLHRLAFSVSKGKILTPPIDPRKAEGIYKMLDYNTATNIQLEYWAKIYDIKLNEEPKAKQQLLNANANPRSEGSGRFYDSNFDVIENYEAKSAVIDWYYTKQRHRSGYLFQGNKILAAHFNCDDLKGNKIYSSTKNGSNSGTTYINNLSLSGKFNYTAGGSNIGTLSIAIKLQCKPKDAFYNDWKKESFEAIIKAYNDAFKTFQEEQEKLDEEQKKKEAEAKDKMGKFYRHMEHDVLKHNCIAYLLQDYMNVLGTNLTAGDKMEDFQIALGEDLDQYTALAKFMEQAFEWEIMDYTFYPYYWANRQQWKEMYITDSVDPLFRSFLQAGMARIIVTVKPGFEDAVQFFMTTGKIWNGGEVPVIGDPLYMSIVDEMRAPVGEPQGKYWITKIPTTLTILQDKSTGLPVEQPLPIFPEADDNKCENPDELESKSSFESRNISLGIKLGEASTLNSK